MSTAAKIEQNPASTPEQGKRPVVRSWRTTIVLGVLALIGLVGFGLLGPNKDATFVLSQASDSIQLSNLTISGKLTGLVTGLIMALIAVWSFLRARTGKKVPGWAVIVFGVLFVAAFLTWCVSMGDPGMGMPPLPLQLPNLLVLAVASSIPLIYGSMAGVMSERSGVVNIAIEGQLLGGAFSAALFGTAFGSVYVGMIAAAIAGALVSMLLVLFGLKYRVNQVIVGVVLNVLVSGLTAYLLHSVLNEGGNKERFNSTPTLPKIAIPGLSEIPLIGPALFNQTLLAYLMYVAVFVVWFALRRTRWGLRTRAVGEHPKAADTLGVKVNSLRFLNVTIGGALAGLGGSYFTLVSVHEFKEDMTAGSGYIALAAVILGRWNPISAALAGLMFGFATNLGQQVTVLQTPVPSQFFEMLPYLVTILVVAGLVGKSRGPAASGEPYVKE
ncbi:MAG: ABC transporter permease [Galactobacter sp.]